MEYSYPLLHDWSTVEMVEVIAFYEAVEKAYETGISREQLLAAYRSFKQIVPSMAEEKKLLKEFEQVSGYSSYRVVKAAKEGKDGDNIKGIVK